MGKLQYITVYAAEELCLECAEDCYATRMPSDQYVDRTARLLFMTGAHESGGFIYNRQGRYAFTDTHGAHGIWQTEWISVSDSIRLLRKNLVLARRCTQFALGQGADPEWFDKCTKETILQMICVSARVSVMFARVHYLRIKAAIPDTDEKRAAYAKRFYNTSAGKATPEDYLEAFQLYYPDDDDRAVLT